MWISANRVLDVYNWLTVDLLAGNAEDVYLEPDLTLFETQMLIDRLVSLSQEELDEIRIALFDFMRQLEENHA